jgi:hypothetical protein
MAEIRRCVNAHQMHRNSDCSEVSPYFVLLAVLKVLIGCHASGHRSAVKRFHFTGLHTPFLKLCGVKDQSYFVMLRHLGIENQSKKELYTCIHARLVRFT